MLGRGQSEGLARRTLLSAKIIFNDKSSTFDCTVTALSDTGAELRMPSTLNVPGVFKLTIKPHDETYLCDVTWRTETCLGVSFSRTAKALPVVAKKKAPRLEW